MTMVNKEEEILRIYAQRRKELERKQERNERLLRIQELKTEQLYYMNHQIKNLFSDINMNTGEEGCQFRADIEERYWRYYRREIDKANDEITDMKKEKKRLRDLEDRFKRERNTELRKLEKDVQPYVKNSKENIGMYNREEALQEQLKCIQKIQRIVQDLQLPGICDVMYDLERLIQVKIERIRFI